MTERCHWSQRRGGNWPRASICTGSGLIYGGVSTQDAYPHGICLPKFSVSDCPLSSWYSYHFRDITPDLWLHTKVSTCAMQRPVTILWADHLDKCVRKNCWKKNGIRKFTLDHSYAVDRPCLLWHGAGEFWRAQAFTCDFSAFYTATGRDRYVACVSIRTPPIFLD